MRMNTMRINNIKSYSFNREHIILKSNYILRSSVGSTLSHKRFFSTTSVRRMDPINTTIVSNFVSVDPIVFSLFFLTSVLSIVLLATHFYTFSSLIGTAPSYNFNNLLPLFELHYEFTRSLDDVIAHVNNNIDILNENQLRMLNFYLPYIIHGATDVSFLVDF